MSKSTTEKKKEEKNFIDLVFGSIKNTTKCECKRYLFGNCIKFIEILKVFEVYKDQIRNTEKFTK